MSPSKLKKLQKELGVDVKLINRSQNLMHNAIAQGHDIDYLTNVLGSNYNNALASENDLRNAAENFKETLISIEEVVQKLLKKMDKVKVSS